MGGGVMVKGEEQKERGALETCDQRQPDAGAPQAAIAVVACGRTGQRVAADALGNPGANGVAAEGRPVQRDPCALEYQLVDGRRTGIAAVVTDAHLTVVIKH